MSFSSQPVAAAVPLPARHAKRHVEEVSNRAQRPPRLDQAAPLPIRVFVHLAHGFDAVAWRRRWESGELVGVNEPTPYGYGCAAGRLAGLRYSTDRQEGSPKRLARLGLRWALGFDLLHAAANWKAIKASDVVWTHTESQFLAVALLKKLSRGKGPALLGQSVWLFDRWPRLSRAHRTFYAWLIGAVDVLTVHSPENLAVAQKLFPHKRSELVLFGIAADATHPPRQVQASGLLRVVAAGNDRHRDWETAVAAVTDLPGVHLTIISATAPLRITQGVGNADLRRVRSNGELEAVFAEADLVLVPLHRNLHASGITVLQEAAVKGLPAVASDTGGLKTYFTENEVSYVAVGDAGSLRETLAALRDDPERRRAMAGRAQARMGPTGLSSRAFVERHLEISASLMGMAPAGGAE